MVNPLTWLSRRRHAYEPLIKIELSRARLLHNLNEYRNIAPDGQVAPVLKSNAYGHGLKETATILKKEKGIPFFVVDSYFEAVALKSYGIKNDILIIGYTRSLTILNSNLRNAIFCISSLNSLKEISRAENPISIHLKFDTGMRRQGLMKEDLIQASEIILNNNMLRIEGICTHFSDSDNLDTSFTESQINVWNNLVTKSKELFPGIKYFHASATDGHRHLVDIKSNVSRLGIGLYGLSQQVGDFSPNVKPVLKMSTIIVDIKKVRNGETIGYANTFKANRDMTIAIVPAGYFEGIDRRLSNKGSLILSEGKRRASIVGRVSMNITTVDVSDIKEVHIGSPITLVSNETKDPNSILNIAKTAETISYEIACHIPSHLKRVIV